jgi:hypothetical protein
MKPTLDLYIGKRVVAVEQKEDGEAWQWAIVLDDGTRIVNKSRKEVFAPTNIVGLMLEQFQCLLAIRLFAFVVA